VRTPIAGSFDPEGACVAVRPDGRVVAAIPGTLGSQSAWDVYGYTAAGSPDPAFGTAGRVILPFGAGPSAPRASRIQPDGKIAMAGVIAPTLPTFATFGVARLNADGSADPTFGDNGVVPTPLPGLNEASATDMLVEPDGDIVAVGPADPTSEPGSAVVLVRYTPGGGLDPTFGVGGVATTVTELGIRPRGIARDAEGRYLVAGRASCWGPGRASFFARYTAAGALDESFGRPSESLVPGLVLTDTDPGGDEEFFDVAVQPDGRVVAAGWSTVGISTMSAARYYEGAPIPMPVADAYEVDEDTPIVVPDPGVLANDSLLSAATAALATGPAHGSVTLQPDGSFTTSRTRTTPAPTRSRTGWSARRPRPNRSPWR
jgi:uncharacterized delta-60 repeat protein